MNEIRPLSTLRIIEKVMPMVSEVKSLAKPAAALTDVKFHFKLTNVEYIYDEVDNNTYVKPNKPQAMLSIFAGYNGCGQWSNYFQVLSRFMEMLEEEFGSAWLIEIKNDCADDVHYIKIGINAYEVL